LPDVPSGRGYSTIPCRQLERDSVGSSARRSRKGLNA
jgi:hypothetical protein